MLIQAGVYPHSVSTPLDSDDNTRQPLSVEYLVEKMFVDREFRHQRHLHRLHGQPSEMQGLPLLYVGPRTLASFVECLGKIFQEKNSQVAAERAILRYVCVCVLMNLLISFSSPYSHALQTLAATKSTVLETEEVLESLKQKLRVTNSESSKLLTELVAKSCQLERLQARKTENGAVWNAMKMVADQIERAENEEDDRELLAALSERMPRRGSRVDSMLQRTKEQLEVAEKEETSSRIAMNKAKEEVGV